MAQEAEVNQALTICQATAQERNVLINVERLNTLSDYAELTNRDVTELAAKLERRRTVADGRISLPAKVLKNIQALCFWAREKVRKGEDLNEEIFTQEVLTATKEAMRTREEGQGEAPSIKPDRFDPDKWTSWSKQFVTYLSHVNGQQFAPLDYVLREEPPKIPLQDMTERDRRLYSYPLQGRHFSLDNMTAYRLLSDLVNGTSGYTWISDFDRAQNGRAAWLALVEHYEGGGQREKRMTAAVATIKALHYKNESIFSFEDFSRKLVQAYRDLEGTDEEMTNFNKVKTLLEKVQVSLPRAEVAKAHVRQHFRQDIYGAIEYLGTEFADMFADAISFKRGRARGIGAVERPPQRPRTDGGTNEPTRTPDGITTFFGVDVTDVARTFTSQEMTTLGPRGQAYVFQERERLGLSRSTRGGRGSRGRGGGRGINHSNRRVGAIEASGADDVSGITQDTRQLPPLPDREPKAPASTPPAGISSEQSTTSNRGSQNGNGFGAGAYRL
jgi:hypothetical protein